MEVKSIEATAADLTPAQSDLEARARAFVEETLIPLEEEAEERGGRLPDATVAAVKRAAIDAGLDGGSLFALLLLVLFACVLAFAVLVLLILEEGGDAGEGVATSQLADRAELTNDHGCGRHCG